MLKRQKKTTNGTRNQIKLDRSYLHKGDPEKSLLASGHKKIQGRGHKGHITVRHRGSGVKKRLRVIDFRRNKFDVEGIVNRIEYDPNRSANIALIFYLDGEKRYILAPQGLKDGEKVMAGEKIEIKIGNSTTLRNIPLGIPIHNIELIPKHGGQLVRSAGVSAVIQSKDAKYAVVVMPSKEIRLIHLDCMATIGQVGNEDKKNVILGKAGLKRKMGIRPTVRGSAQSPRNHPHGGGEGRCGIGLKHPKTPWGKPALGKKTRSKRKYTNRFIIKDRRKK
jgi:large subunit ribosomal protein L2